VSVIALAAAKSSPGVTTLAELVVQLRPTGRRCALLDCDPAGGDWLLRPGVAPEPGLVSLATAGRRDLRAGELSAHLQVLGEGLEVLVAPAAARQASGALDLVGERLVAHLRALDAMDAVIDCGSLAPASPALSLVRAADLVVLVSRPTARAMVHLAPWVEQLVGEGLVVVVVLVDGTRARHEATYRPDEVVEALGVEVLGPVADDVAAAARLYREPGCLASLRGSALVRSTIPVAEAVFARCGSQPAPAPAWQSYAVVVP
jgi:MinD-like ATPase involved in chromosome partitioning or flagellar assembly